MPPLRTVSNCSPSARAHTVTAHSLKAIGIKVGEERVEKACMSRPGTMRHDPARDSDRETSGPGVTYYAQAREISKLRCKWTSFTNDAQIFMQSANAPHWLEARAGDALHHFEHRREVLVAEAPSHPRAVELGR